jgi:hypothetical protein
VVKQPLGKNALNSFIDKIVFRKTTDW